MEPLKLNIEVTLSDESINKLVTALGAAIGGSFAGVLAKLANGALEEAPKAEAVEEPAAPVEAAPAPQEKPADDIPEDLPITDEEMAEATRAAVTRLKAAGKSILFIRTEIFAKYGCNNSAGCPLSKRPALLEELQNIEK
ncbi:MAG: hypothetical protein KBS78_07415 [Bacteroidales bacterium]|nr:hypothetical protein [Candidatus Cryptobacteroides faecihippi]